MSTSRLLSKHKKGRRFDWPRIFFAIGIMVLFSGIACSRKDPIDVLMADLKEAVEDRDVKAVEKLLAADFTGQESVSRDEALTMLRRYFAGYEQVNVDVTQVELPTDDRVRFRASFRGKGKEALELKDILPSNVSYHFELWLVDEGGILKVQKAFWNELSGF